MAALLPTILSDDEEVDSNNDSSSSNRFKKKDGGDCKTSSKKGNNKKKISSSRALKQDSKNKDIDHDKFDDGSTVSDDEMDQDFEFGGLLGEDGSSFDALSSTLDGSSGADKNAWSYKSALALLSSNDNAGLGAEVERTSVASIIAAARSNLRRGRGDEEVDEKKKQVKGESGSESTSGDDSNDDDDDDDASDHDDSSSSDDEVDDVDKATHAMESDVLKVQERPQRTKKGKKAASASVDESSSRNEVDYATSEDDDNEESGEDDDDDDDEEEREDDSEDEQKEASKAAAFFDSSHIASTQELTIDTFSQLGLSRPLLRGVASMGFVSPTPIQASVIPVALAGRDVCASAVTGSGKTAAFLLPIMERIMQRGGGRATLGGPNAKKKQSSMATTRALVLAPTRELAAQCVSMMMAMAKFTELRAALIVGGAKNVMSQATELRTRPDVVVATPGRLLDHITNSQGVDMDDVEFLVLDEADRLLDLGFQDEVHEIIKSCPIERQTMLFSATMSTKVDDLIKLSLKRPVRISATDKKKAGQSTSDNGVEVAPRLEQEFIRIRAGNEGVSREGMLLALLTRTFKTRTIVFFDTKSAAHRLMIVCGLCGIKCAELHGNLTQVQRLEALEAFREGSVDVLLATDLAARGLDISGVEAVINFEMPSQVTTYVHRIGRTARAGRGGKSCTLIGEGRRYLMKEVVKDADEKNRKQKQEGGSNPMGVIRSRTIPSAVVAHFVAKINSLEQHVQEVMDAEAVARLDRIAEMEAVRAQNIIEHSQSIKQRPQKEWFATPKQKMSVKEATAERKRMIEEKVGTGTHRMTRKKRRAQEARAMFQEAKEEAAEREEETGKKSKMAYTEGQIKGAARASKKKEAQREKDHLSRSINDDDLRKERKRKQKQKVANPDAAGDGGLFSEEYDTFAKKTKKDAADAPEKSSYFFKDYDPSKKMGKKKAHHGFKSKSKYKRR